MKSYTTLRNLYGSLTNNTSTTNLTLGDQFINDGIRIIMGNPANQKFLETSFTKTTTSGTSTYFLPYNYDKLSSVKITSGSYDFVPQQVKSRNRWNRIIAVSYQSDYPTYYYLNPRSIEFFPIPSTTSNVITFNYKKRVVDLSNADYTTGTITATNNSTTIAGAGTTFTTAMIGRYLKVNADGNWYLITGFTNATTISIEQAYQGTTVAGAAYTIGEMSVIPENYDRVPVYYAVSQYWYQNDDVNRGKMYDEMFKEGIKMIQDNNISSSMDLGIINQNRVEDPNLYPQNIT